MTLNITKHGELSVECWSFFLTPQTNRPFLPAMEVNSDDITVNEVMAALQETAHVNPGAVMLVAA